MQKGRKRQAWLTAGAAITGGLFLVYWGWVVLWILLNNPYVGIGLIFLGVPLTLIACLPGMAFGAFCYRLDLEWTCAAAELEPSPRPLGSLGVGGLMGMLVTVLPAVALFVWTRNPSAWLLMILGLQLGAAVGASAARVPFEADDLAHATPSAWRPALVSALRVPAPGPRWRLVIAIVPLAALPVWLLLLDRHYIAAVLVAALALTVMGFILFKLPDRLLPP